VFEENGVSGTTTSTPATEPPPAAVWTPDVMAGLYRGRTVEDLTTDACWTAAGCAAVDLILHPERSETTVTAVDADLLASMARVLFGPDPAVSVYFGALASARARAILRPVLWRVKLVARELLRLRRMDAEAIARAMYPETLPTP
jgi:hypothetical protein